MFCYYFLYFSISPRGFIRNMNVLFDDILLIFIPDREIRGVMLRPPTPPPKKKKIGGGGGSLQGFGPQFGLKIRGGPGPHP